VQIHANCRLRRIYFTDQALNSKKLPPEYKVFAAVEEDTAEKNYVAQDIVQEVNEDKF
jgi:hypothetical protein